MASTEELKNFLNIIFGSQDRGAVSRAILLGDSDRPGPVYFAIFNADFDHICTLHQQQVMYLYVTMDGLSAEYWLKLGLIHPARIPYEPTDEEYDELASRDPGEYFSGY